MRACILLFFSLILSGCMMPAPNLPPVDTITKIKPLESGVMAESDRYTYYFQRNGARQEYQRYNTFYPRFSKIAAGVKVLFTVDQHDVEALYTVIFDKKNLNSQQQAILLNEYKAKTVENNQLGVEFKATGEWVIYPTPKLDDTYRLSTPITVTINDTSQKVSPLGEVMIIPLFPIMMLAMMFGCATSQCV